MSARDFPPSEERRASLPRDYARATGRSLWLTALLMALGALAEGFGLLMIVPLAAVAIGGEAPLGAGRFSEIVASIPQAQRFPLALALFLGAMALRSILLFARDMLGARVQADYETSLKIRAAATLAQRGWPFASRIGQAGMQSLLLNDVPRSSQAAHSLQAIVAAAIMLLVQLALAAMLSPALTLFVLVLIAGGLIALKQSIARVARSGSAIVRESEESAGAGLRLHSGLKSALAQGTIPQFLTEYGAALGRLRAEGLDYSRHYQLARQLAAFGAALAAAALLFVGAILLKLPFPILAASLVLFARMTGPAIALQQSIQQYAVTAPAFAAIVRRLGGLDPVGRAVAAPEPLRWKLLAVDQAGFDHGAGRGIESVGFALGAREWLGIAGRSAAGKTTLLDMVAGLIAPQTGSVEVDGKPLAGELLDRWRAGLAYVGQEGALFNDTVRANLLADGARAADDALWAVLRQCGLDARVGGFDRGLDQEVGDRGSLLSGGERQRLVIARALLRKPTLLILDEATAAIDADAEAELLASIRAGPNRPAALVVAHRDSTLAHCDRVVAIQHGRIVGAKARA
jgi:ATP-binding cassette subfamily C protein